MLISLPNPERYSAQYRPLQGYSPFGPSSREPSAEMLDEGFSYQVYVVRDVVHKVCSPLDFMTLTTFIGASCLVYNLSRLTPKEFEDLPKPMLSRTDNAPDCVGPMFEWIEQQNMVELRSLSNLFLSGYFNLNHVSGFKGTWRDFQTISWWFYFSETGGACLDTIAISLASLIKQYRAACKEMATRGRTMPFEKECLELLSLLANSKGIVLSGQALT